MHPMLQRLVPQHLLSRLSGVLANCQHPQQLKSWVIRYYIKHHGIDMSEAQLEQPEAYTDFNAFFTRRLKAAQRPIGGTEPTSLISPADGRLDQFGPIEFGRLVQAKGVTYGLTQLLGGHEVLSDQFVGGSFVTIYLSPRDYHRVHMPIDGQLQKMVYIPGRLFSVNAQSAAAVDAIFTRNERAVFYFDSALGPVAIVMVGAMLVASIHTAWAGRLQARTAFERTYAPNQIVLARGEELGYFQLGSTVIMLTSARAGSWQHSIRQGERIKMGTLLTTS